MVSSLIHLSKIDSTLSVITLNRPDKRNALNIPLLEELSTTFEILQKDSDLRAVILNGEGSIFCAGMDLQEAADHSKIEIFSQLLQKVLSTIYLSPLVTIAAVHGAVIGGGMGLIGACDFTLSALDTLFSLPETRRGLVPALVSVFLKHRLSSQSLRELALVGSPIDAQRANEIGLVDHRIPLDQLLNSAKSLADSILKGAPIATRETKKLFLALEAGDLAQHVSLALDLHHRMRRNQEAAEGTAAFLEKRVPNWVKK